MKQLMRFGGLGLTLVCLMGCIQVDMVVKVKPDGSGTVEETVLVARDAMQGVQEVMKGIMESMASQIQMEGRQISTTESQGDAFGKDFEFFDEAKLRENARTMGPGVTYVSGGRVQTEKAEGYRALYAFTNINTLRLSTSPSGKAPPVLGNATGIPGVKQSFALFRFSKGPPAVLGIVLPEEMTTDNLQPPQLPGSPATGAPKMAIPEQMTKLFQDMKMRIAVEIEGEILRTNATHRHGSTITLMDVDFGKLLGKLETLQKINEEMNRNPAKAKESLKKLPGVTVELNREVHVEFAGTQPRDAAYWIDKGAIAHTYGNPEAAIRYYTKAIKLDPNNPSAHFNMGLSYETMGQYERALSSIDKAIELNPAKGQYYYGRGNVHLMAGDKDRAVEDFRHAAELGDESAQSYFDSMRQNK